MLSFADALALISTKVQTHRMNERMAVRIALEESLGFTCARAIASGENFPARPTSAMDGFAIQSFLTLAASPSTPVVLRVEGEIAAGR